MLKPLLFASAMLIAAPALAQEAPAQDKTTPPAASPDKAGPTLEQANPAPGESSAARERNASAPIPASQAAPAPAQAAPTPAPTPAPAQSTQPTPTPQSTEANASAPAPGQPANTEAQVAQVVQSEFGTYDADKSGGLNQGEFGTWMGALRKAADANYDSTSPAATQWASQAFTAADKDKDGTVSQAELTGFLSQGKQ